MIRRLATIGWLVVVWLIASESATLASVVGGVVAGLLVTTFFHYDAGSRGRGRTTFRPVAAVRVLGYFLVKLARANAEVAVAVIQPSRVERRRGIVAVPLADGPETVLWLLANAVSLTPGTSIVEERRDPPTFYVHVLLLRSVTTTRHDVLEMQRQLLLAFGPREAIDDVEHRLAALPASPTPDLAEEPAR